MRLRLPVFMVCAVTSSLAVAGGGGGEPSFSFSAFFFSIPFGLLLTVVVVYGALFKLFARWPEHERWLVGTSLLLLPVATYLVSDAFNRYGIGYLFIYSGSGSAAPQTFLFWAVVALLLGIAWWLLKTRTTLLSAPAAASKSARDAQALDQYRREWTAAREAQWEAFANTQAPRPQSVSPPPASASSPAPQPKPAKPAAHINDTIFISYRRQDSADATGRIYDRLIQHFGREQVFKDVDSIPLGVDFREHLGNVVGRCNFLIVVIGPQWSTATGPNGRRLEDKSDFVRVEIEAALARNIPVIPVLIGGAELPAETELPPSLGAITYRNGISVRPDPDFHRDMDRLIAGLEQHGRG